MCVCVGRHEVARGMHALLVCGLAVHIYMCVCVCDAFFYLIRLIQSFVHVANSRSVVFLFLSLFLFLCPPLPSGEWRHRRPCRRRRCRHHLLVVCGSCGKLKLVVYFAQHKQISTTTTTITQQDTKDT